MDFYEFVAGVACLEKLVTAICPIVISEFERRFDVSVEEARVEIRYIPERLIHVYEVRIRVKCKKGEFAIPVAELREGTPVLHGIEYAFKKMIKTQ